MIRTAGLMLIVLLSTQLAARAAPGLERGRYLLRGIVACGNCHAVHGDKGEVLPARGLAGGFVYHGPPFTAYAANITPDRATGIGHYSDAQLAKAIREGVRPDNSVIGPPMPIPFYRHLSDDDVASIVMVLKSEPPVANAVPRSIYRMPLPPTYGPPVGEIRTPSAASKVAYGEYLANIGHCMECHTARGAGGALAEDRWGAGGQVFNGPWGVSVSRNLTPTGLADWTDAQIATAVRGGVDRHGQAYRPPMAFEFYKNISDDDMSALTAYLRSLKPAEPPSTP